ncbi:MAG: peptidoglycan LD-endopeptidase LytH [Frankiales bacterium]|nr:peptidoglycan LD-endopeptidase LytH [Frankiales bacterium]
MRTTSAPVVASGEYVFPLECKTSYGHSHHDYPATDLFAARGCRFVSPIAGTVDEVTYKDTWSSSSNRGADRGGLSVSVVGTDGVRYYGSHLERIAPGIRPGLRVAAGKLLGYVGNTGSARGIATHLHFGLSWPTRHGTWWVRRGEVYPWPYLDSWKAGGHRSPAAAVEAKRRQVGTYPPCTSYC